MDNNLVGCLTEYTFATECLKRGYNVSFPLLDSSIYDCIVDTGDRLIKVQVKSTAKKPEGYRKSVQCRISNNKAAYDIDKVDYFAVWVDLYSGFFIFKNKGSMQTIRLSIYGDHKEYFNNFAFD